MLYEDKAKIEFLEPKNSICCNDLKKELELYIAKLDEGIWENINNPKLLLPSIQFKYNGIVSQNLIDGRVLEFELQYEEKETFFEYCTLKNLVKEKPVFPLGKIAGKYERLPLGPNDVDGGLRVKGKYKKDLPDRPLITYITVVFNRIDTLPQCMESIWRQDYDNVEYIVIDGGSTDGTLELIQAHENHIDYFVSQKDTGIYNAMNKGISLASGRYICFINSDDICKEHAAKKIANIYSDRDKKPVLIAGRREMMNANGKIIKEIPFPRYRIHKEAMFPLPIHHQSVYAQRELFDDLGYYEESFKFIADYRWEINCITKYEDIEFTEEELSIFSIGGLTGTSSPIKRWDEWTRLSNELFPNLTYKQAEILHYSIRHFWQYCEIGTLLKTVKNNLKNSEFSKTLYETSWYICQIELIYLKNMVGKNSIIFQECLEPLYRLFSDKCGTEIDIESILEWINQLLIYSVNHNDIQYRIEDFSFIKDVKHEINRCYSLVKAQKATSQHERNKIRFSYWLNSLAAKNGYLTLYVAKKAFRR